MSSPSIPAGWYPDPSGAFGQRYWDGTTWTDHSQAGLSERERSAILQQALTQNNVTQVITQNPTSAAVLTGQPVNHVVHLLATVFLCGLWLPFWIIMATTGGQKRYSVSVDEFGGVHWKLGG